MADARAWFVKAANDLRGAEIDLAAEPPLLDDCTFHCQQAVEKTLKGFLNWHQRPFRRTHDLGEIGGQCVQVDPSLEPLLRQAAPLTEYAWKFRYPGEPDEVPRGEAEEAFRLAREIYEAVLGHLPSALRP